MSRRQRKRRQPQQSPRHSASPRGASLWAAAVGAVAFGLYLATICPTVIDQDSGELVAAAHVLGVPHPTGYPLWTMLARIFDYLPVGGTSAYRVALLSAISAAGAAGLVSWVLVGVGCWPLASALAGLAFALWLPTWSQAVRPEVYALEALLFLLSVSAFLRWAAAPTPRSLHWVALAAGALAMHHRTGLLAVAPMVAAALWLTRPLGLRRLASAAILFLAPFACYSYLPIRAAARPPMNWGDPATLPRFVDHVLGRQYARWAFANPPEVVWQEVVKLSGQLLAGGGWPSVALAALGGPVIVCGLRAWSRRDRVAAFALAAGAMLLVIWVLEWGDTSDSKVWLTPLGAVLALYGGRGLHQIAFGGQGSRARQGVAAALGLGVCGLLVVANWSRSDQSNVWKHRDRWRAALAQMEPRAIFLCEWDDPMFAAYYLQQVEGFRKDVIVLRPHGLWGGWYEEQIPDQELREVAPRLWREISRRYGIQHPGTEAFWEGSARLAWELARHFRGRRTVYTLHGPYRDRPPGPPYFVGLSDHLYRLDFAPPPLGPVPDPGGSAASLPGGAELASVVLSSQRCDAGELVEFRAHWRLREPLPGLLFALRLVPADPTAREASQEGKSELVQGFPVLYGQWGLAPAPPGKVYEQRAWLIAPSNAAGRYRLQVGFSRQYPPRWSGWVDLSAAGVLAIRPRPLPANPP